MTYFAIEINLNEESSCPDMGDEAFEAWLENTLRVRDIRVTQDRGEDWFNGLRSLTCNPGRFFIGIHEEEGVIRRYITAWHLGGAKESNIPLAKPSQPRVKFAGQRQQHRAPAQRVEDQGFFKVDASEKQEDTLAAVDNARDAAAEERPGRS